MNIAIEHIVKVNDDLYYCIGYDLATFEKTAIRGNAEETLPVLERFKNEELLVLEIGK